jgi:hypothetical protein
MEKEHELPRQRPTLQRIGVNGLYRPAHPSATKVVKLGRAQPLTQKGHQARAHPLTSSEGVTKSQRP